MLDLRTSLDLPIRDGAQRLNQTAAGFTVEQIAAVEQADRGLDGSDGTALRFHFDYHNVNYTPFSCHLACTEARYAILALRLVWLDAEIRMW